MKKVVTFGEIMMRLSAPANRRFAQADNLDIVYGGSEANVGVSLSVMGIPAAHVTAFPDNDLGRAAVANLQKYGVDTQHIRYGEGRLGLYFLEQGAMERPSKIVYDRENSAFSHIKSGEFDWKKIFENASWFHYTGITPAISQGAADVCLEALEAAKDAGIPISGDINYRRNLWNYGKKVTDVMPELISKTDYIIAGARDFQNCLGLKAEGFEEACVKAKQMMPGIKKVASTVRITKSADHNELRGNIWDGERIHSSRSYEMPAIIDRIGGGDAFMAGLIYGWQNFENDADTVEYATAASVLKHSIPGDVNLVTTDEVQTLAKGENTGKLLR